MRNNLSLVAEQLNFISMKRNKILNCLYIVSFILLFSSSVGICQNTFYKTYGGSQRDAAFCIKETSDSGYIITGYNSENNTHRQKIIVFRTNSNGDTLWTRILPYYIEFLASININDEVLLACNSEYFNGIYQYSFLIKIDPYGNTKWVKSIQDTLPSIHAMLKTEDGGFIYTGYNSLLLKTDSLGNVIWKKNMITPIPNAYNPSLSSMIRTRDGGYLFAGTISRGMYEDMFIIRTDSLGDTLWTKVPGHGLSIANSCEQLDDGTFIIGGFGFSIPVLVRIDSLGNTLWAKYFGQDAFPFSISEVTSVTKTFDGGIVATGYIQKSYDSNSRDIFILKTNINGDVTQIKENVVFNLPNSFSLKQNYPNPFNPSTTISYSIPKQTHVELKVFDLLGREIIKLVNHDKSAGEYKVQFDGSNLPSGVYIYTIRAGEFQDSKKLILIK